MKIRLLLSLIILCQSFCAFSETIVVSNKADSGPNTLREAIKKAAANGTTEVDYIHFNLPGTTDLDRTILLKSSLPALTSKIVIDGSTQPSAPIGSSDARVIIKTLQSYDDIVIIVFTGRDVEQLEFYGIYFWDTTSHYLSNPGDQKRAIEIVNGKDIIIGIKDKGNALTGYYGHNAGVEIEGTDGLKIGGNLFGIDPYTSRIMTTEGIVLRNVNNLELGGPDSRNIIFTGFTFYYSNTETIFNVKVNNNNILVHKDGVSTEPFIRATFMTFYGAVDNSGEPRCKINLDISDNLFSNHGVNGAIYFDMGGVVNVYHNWFGVDRTNKIRLAEEPISDIFGNVFYSATSNAEIIFGHEDPALGNIVGYSKGVQIGDITGSMKIIRNSFRCLSGRPYVYNDESLPQVQVTENTVSYVKGKSTPLAVVDVYLSDDCEGCSPETFIGTTKSSASGDWRFDYPTPYARDVLVNAHVGKQSSDFSYPVINTAGVEITNVNCSNKGQISGIVVNNSDKIRWVNEKGETVSADLELKDMPPGNYKLIIGEFCTAESEYFTIKDLSPLISTEFMSVKQPSCGSSDGSIANIVVNTPDDSQIAYSWTNQDGKIIANTRNIANLPPGLYTLKASSSTCSTTYGPIILKSPNTPTIDLSSVLTTESPCGQALGSISNVKVSATGKIEYAWKDEKGGTVGNTINLQNVTAGTYTLQITDEGSCGPVYSTPIIIKERNGISINTANMVVTKSSCSSSSGSITGIAVAGATEFKWVDASNVVVATALALTGMPSGRYRLITSNLVCEKSTGEISIDLQESVNLYQSSHSVTNTTCGLANGKIEVVFESAQPQSCFWNNELGQRVGDSRILENQAAGTYDLYIIDDLGCTKFHKKYIIANDKTADISFKTARVINDQCGSGEGQIIAPEVSGGQLPYYYEWKNRDGNILGNEPVLKNLKAGTYQLTIGDKLICGRQTLTYTVSDQSATLTMSKTANSISPNSDGRNDVWQIPGIADHPTAIVSIYNRYGTRVFQSVGYNTPFDGRSSGSDLPMGTYYYIIDLNNRCGLQKGSLTIIR